MAEPLGRYVDLKRGTTYRGNLLGKTGPVLLGLASIEPNGGFRRTSLKTYGGDSPASITLEPGDIYVSLKDVTQSGDLLGAVARVPSDVALGRLTQDTVKLVLKPGASADYLYWLLRTPQYRDYCRARATGTTNLGLARDDFLSFPVPEPTQVRQKLVDLLGALDDKIELDRRMNETLEEIARTTFAGFVNRLDRRSGRFGDIASLRRVGVDPAEAVSTTPYIALEHMPRRSIALTDWGTLDGVVSGKSAFEAGSILFGKLRPYFHKAGIAPIAGACSTDILVIEPRSPAWFAFALMHASSDAFVAYADATSSGTKMPRASWKDLASYELSLPTEDQARALDIQIRPLVDRIVHNVHESRTLAELRDALLPKLISGELRVRDAEKAL